MSIGDKVYQLPSKIVGKLPVLALREHFEEVERYRSSHIQLTSIAEYFLQSERKNYPLADMLDQHYLRSIELEAITAYFDSEIVNAIISIDVLKKDSLSSRARRAAARATNAVRRIHDALAHQQELLETCGRLDYNLSQELKGKR